ncbi:MULTISPECIES: hypothetical protein [Streptomyces]|uniref:Uncharacterized protein n=1 Tax=Streptomyces fungicidicus TaxID=68203 RepID=A0ACC7Y3W8_9ACTN|nr:MULTISPECIES: hypothetical protein [Streptomyces]MBF4135929.1 hypothetical protein [Streptomyces albidoflavus]NUV76448.1 hypothetical protein [Streptomyces fungicidicus]PAX85915.1 hypothetical protein CLM81_11260 [Streptomyces albidoflavus]PAX87790.1 hypothetical protein CLM82_25705 [Streptomyces albidoflavus]PBO18354.1 hypothetical protein CLM83_12830 [Streptomyces albidoflavus]
MVTTASLADAQEPEPQPSADAQRPDLWFVLPPGFLEFDVQEDAEDRVPRMVAAVEALFDSATALQKFSLVASSAYILQTMIQAGAEHISSGLLRMPDGQLSQATFCVIVERPDTGPVPQDRRVTAKRTAQQWRDLHPGADVGLIMLPYGIAALCVREEELSIPGALFGVTEPVVTTVLQAQFCVPLKTGPGTALYALTTEDVANWPSWLELLGGIMKSVSAEEPADGAEGSGEPRVAAAPRGTENHP